MSDGFGFIVAIVLAVITCFGGYAAGKDIVRNNIITACVARNPDMPNSKIKEHCEAEFAFVTTAPKQEK